jgi:glycosyltransferase involved in cell wall biosynthesis
MIVASKDVVGMWMLEQLSVVVPTRNEANRIGGLLASLPSAIELVVVDASDDATPDIVLALRPERTRVIRSRAGIAEARQIGAQAARGEWLVLTDADVAFEPGYFARIGQHCHGDGFYGPKLATERHPTYDAVFSLGQQFCDRLGFPAASGSNMAIRKRALIEAGGFRLDLPVNEDTELFLRMAYQGYQIRYVPELAVRSLDDRRLDRGATRKLVHSAARSALIALDLRIAVPQRLLRHDWGYWKKATIRRQKSESAL